MKYIMENGWSNASGMLPVFTFAEDVPLFRECLPHFLAVKLKSARYDDQFAWSACPFGIVLKLILYLLLFYVLCLWFLWFDDAMPFLLLNPLEAASLPKIWDHQPALWAITDSDVSELEAEMSWIILFFLLNTQSFKLMVTIYVFHSSFLANGCLPADHIFWIKYF
jgi:hypothetical protein